jgi:hypothetical protein
MLPGHLEVIIRIEKSTSASNPTTDRIPFSGFGRARALRPAPVNSTHLEQSVALFASMTTNQPELLACCGDWQLDLYDMLPHSIS